MDRYVTFLEEDDERSRRYRARRLEVISAEFGPARALLFPGGIVAAEAFEEARHSYVRGLHIATVLLAQVALEHMLAGLLHMAGHDGRWGFAEILVLARQEGHISANEFDVFDRLRSLRNPYVHTRLPLDSGGLARRALADETDPHAVMDDDATLAITTLLGLVQRRPFDLSA